LTHLPSHLRIAASTGDGVREPVASLLVDKALTMTPVPLLLNIYATVPLAWLLPASVGAVWLKEVIAYTMHGCPCGHFGDLVHSCACSSIQIIRYLARISGSQLDRIPSRFAALQIEVPRLSHEDLLSIAPGEGRASIRERVCAARRRFSARSLARRRRAG
jgi:hypothetical protein